MGPHGSRRTLPSLAMLGASLVLGCATEQHERAPRDAAPDRGRRDGRSADALASDGLADHGAPDAAGCLIDGAWYAVGAAHPDADCALCDPHQSAASWTVTTGCLIDGACLAAGAAHPEGCATCDPPRSATRWSPAPGKCLIESGHWPGCRDAGAPHPSGDCARCDPQASQRAWTVTTGCLIDDACVASGTPGENDCAICDPQRSKTGWSDDSAGKCAISYGGWGSGEKRCYPHGSPHFAGDCAICDVTNNPRAWTRVKGCLILDECQAAGDAVGCGVCDPAQSAIDWTELAGCSIPGFGCVAQGTAHPWGATCAVCDATQSSTSWTVLAGCLIDGNCYASGEPLVAGSDCAVCDPQTSTTSWTPGPGGCVLSTSPGGGTKECVGSGAPLSPFGCGVCDPQQSQTAWTVVAGCLIDNQCAAPGSSCAVTGGGPGSGACNPGCWLCDPARSKTSWSPGSDRCATSAGECFAAGDTLWGGCAVCDGSTSPPSWKVLSGCLIAGGCVQTGSKEERPDGCGLCDPTRSDRRFSPPIGQCLLGRACVADGAKDATGCLACDASASPWAWSAAPGASAVAYSFDTGALGGVTLGPAVDGVGWQLSARRAADGTTALWFGDPLTGASTDDRRTRGEVTLPPALLQSGKPAALSFMFWSDTPDRLVVLVDQTVVWFNTPPQYIPDPSRDEPPWQPVIVDLSAYAGKSVVIRFVYRGEAQQPWWPWRGGGLFLDAIRVVSGCP